MSIAKVKAAAAAEPGIYVTLPASELAKALEEAGMPPEKGSLAEHVAEKVRLNPEAVMQVHRDAHLGKLLGVKESAVTAPAKSKLES